MLGKLIMSGIMVSGITALIGKIINKKNKEIFAQKLTIQMQSILIEICNKRLEKEEISKEEEA